MSGLQTIPLNNVATEAFVAAFMNAGDHETQDALKPFWLDAMRIGNRRLEVQTLSPARGSFVPALARNQLDAAWVQTQALTRLWSASPAPAAAGIPAAVNTIAGLRNTVSQLSRDYFGNPYNTTLRADNRVVVDSQLATQILQLTNKDTTRTQFLQIVADQYAIWTVPRLRVWFTALGVPAVANGDIRLQQLPQVAGVNVHLTNYLANVDDTARIDDPIATVMDALFPPAGGNWLGTHVTVELFGPVHANNPHYYKGQGWRSNATANGQLAGLPGGIAAVQVGMQTVLTNALAAYQLLAQAFMAMRVACVV